METFTLPQVEAALKNLGRYRARRAQQVANVGAPDGISGAHLLALGLRETHLKNIRGGAEFDNATQKWVKQQDYRKQDVGVTQISELWHRDALVLMPGVKEGTWGPTVPGRSAADPGHCPRYTDALRFTLEGLHEAQEYGADHDVDEGDLVRFAIAAHNAGIGGALKGYRSGNTDRFTTGGDYSEWVLRHVMPIREALDRLKWRVTG